MLAEGGDVIFNKVLWLVLARVEGLNGLGVREDSELEIGKRLFDNDDNSY